MSTPDNEKLPLGIYRNHFQSTSYKRFMIQTQSEICFIPLADIKLYQRPAKHWDIVPDLIQAHRMVTDGGLPSFLLCRILDEVWWSYLQEYGDQQLVDLIQFGFRLDFNRDYPLQSTIDNHASANEHIGEVEKYLSTELQHKALTGPFSKPPFPIHVSPLMTRPKQDSSKRRTIVDLSWPEQFSVNAGVNKHKYLDTYFKLQYPSVDNITDAPAQLGPGAIVNKVDISRASRHLRIDT